MFHCFIILQRDNYPSSGHLNTPNTKLRHRHISQNNPLLPIQHNFSHPSIDLKIAPCLGRPRFQPDLISIDVVERGGQRKTGNVRVRIRVFERLGASRGRPLRFHFPGVVGHRTLSGDDVKVAGLVHVDDENLDALPPVSWAGNGEGGKRGVLREVGWWEESCPSSVSSSSSSYYGKGLRDTAAYPHYLAKNYSSARPPALQP